MQNGEVVVGLSRNRYDNSACVLRDGEPISAIALERVNRCKHAGNSNLLYGAEDAESRALVEHCLRVAGVQARDVALLVKSNFFYGDRPVFGGVQEVSHHIAHAYSAFPLTPFHECAVLVADATGSAYHVVSPRLRGRDVPGSEPRFEAESLFHVQGRSVSVVDKRWHQRFYDNRSVYPNREYWDAELSLGIAYSTISEIVFGTAPGVEGKLMGLAPFGDPNAFRDLHIVDYANNQISLPLSNLLRLPHVEEHLTTGICNLWREPSFRKDCANLAWKIQHELETAILFLLEKLHRETGTENLCFAGGVALNCQLNARIVERSPFSKIFVPPAPGDDGVALGCAFYGHLETLGRAPDASLAGSFSPFLGSSFGDADYREALCASPDVEFEKRTDVLQKAARLLAQGEILAVFRGPAEFGPRALGHRSILCNPEKSNARETINKSIKRRESFRPFAPSVLRDFTQDFFELDIDSPFMSFSPRARRDAAGRIDSVLHVDGTGRLGTVEERTNPTLYRILEEFHRLTGLPMLLNTSFNVHEPIVETPAQALATFRKAPAIDRLILGEYLVQRGGEADSVSRR